MSYEYEYKQQIEPYRWLLIKRIDDLQNLIRMKNKLLRENGLSYLLLIVDDLYNACMNVYDILPKSVEVDTSEIEKTYSKLVTIRYEDLIADEKQRTEALKLFHEFTNKIHYFINELIKKLDEQGLLLRKDRVPIGGETVHNY